MHTEHTYFDAVVLGIVQGLTEFFPVSSDGHLIVVSHWLGISGPKLFFDVMLHSGTLLAVLLVFGGDVLRMFSAAGRGVLALLRGQGSSSEIVAGDPELRLGLLVILATIPTGIIGLLLKDFIDQISTLLITGVFLALSGVLLWFTRGRGESGREAEAITARDALLIGLVQGAAVLPGLSRSGSTISSGIGLGLSRAAAGRFSFLLSIPAVLGAVVLHLGESLQDPPEQWGPILVGSLVSFLVGFMALRALLWVVRGGKLYAFAYYVFPVGVAISIWGALHGS
jgi:undecaprenyl-diphosphatase